MNKEDRIKYIGFNDFWFMVIGIVLLSAITTYLFNTSILDNSLIYIIINWSIGLMFSTVDWLIIRKIMIQLRKRFPAFKDSTKRIIFFFLSIFAVVLIVDTVGNILLAAIFKENFNPLDRVKTVLLITIISIMTMAIYEAVYFYLRLKKSVQEEEQAKQAKVQAQLDALSNQAQPHFFFNSLNTLRDIIDRNSKEDAALFVNKLSNVYRYILEANNSNFVSFEKELKFSKSYMHIQQERFGGNFSVEWSIADESLSRSIAPLSLQLLLENAIKHNVVSKSKPLYIYVTANAEELVVKNKLQPKSSKTFSTKLGLQNIQKRYELISDKTIKIEDDGDDFTVTLPLLNGSEHK